MWRRRRRNARRRTGTEEGTGTRTN